MTPKEDLTKRIEAAARIMHYARGVKVEHADQLLLDAVTLAKSVTEDHQCGWVEAREAIRAYFVSVGAFQTADDVLRVSSNEEVISC